MRRFVGHSSAYALNFGILLFLFSLANVLDVFSGRSDAKYYPIVTYMIFAFVVSWFLYMGWTLAYFVNATVFYAAAAFSVFHHPASNTMLSWIFGSIPFPDFFLFGVPCIFLSSIALQLIHNRYKEDSR